jgi:hypothetical protein
MAAAHTPFRLAFGPVMRYSAAVYHRERPGGGTVESDKACYLMLFWFCPGI